MGRVVFRCLFLLFCYGGFWFGCGVGVFLVVVGLCVFFGRGSVEFLCWVVVVSSVGFCVVRGVL